MELRGTYNNMVNKPAKVILYAKEDQSRIVFNKMITGLIPKENMEVFGTIADLTSRLRWPQCEFTIVILLMLDEEDLERVLMIRALLDNVSVILVLPDGNADTVMRGHTLRPRFVSVKDGPLSDVAAVLARMIEVH